MSERRLLRALGVAHAVTHVEVLALAALFPGAYGVCAEMGLDDAGAGLLATALAAPFGLMALPAGVLADRFGARRVVLASLVLGAVGALAVGLAPDASVLVPSLMLLGMAAGLYHPAGVALLTVVVRRRGEGLGYHGIAGNVGEAIAPFAVAILADLWGGWRAAYLALAPLSLLAALLAWRDLPGRARTDGVASSRDGAPSGRRGVVVLLALYALLVAGGFVYRGVITFLPKRVAEAGGFHGLAEAGFVTSLALGAGAIGQLVGGRLADRVRPELLAAGTLFLGAAALLLAGGEGLVAVAVGGGLWGLCHFGGQPATNALMASLSAPGWRGRAYGMQFALAFGVGAVGAWAGGRVAGAWGLPAVFPVLGIGSLVGAVLALVLWKARGSGGPSVPQAGSGGDGASAGDGSAAGDGASAVGR